MIRERATYYNYLQFNGFRTGLINLPGLDFPIELDPKRHFIRYDGPVDSIENYLNVLPEPFRQSLSRYDYSRAGAFNTIYALGRSSQIPIAASLMVVRNVSPRFNISNAAHEASEIAVRLGLHQQLYEGLENMGYRINFNGFTAHEIGLVCGYIAALNYGYDLSKIYLRDAPEGIGALMKLGLI